MPFQDDENLIAPLALPEGFDLNPEQETSSDGFLGAAFRRENPIVSSATSFEYDRNAPFDPSYEPFKDIQGTIYEPYWDRFTDARNSEQAGMMKAQIDRELEDRATLDAAGGWGFAAEIGAAILSPTSLLPGGAVVKGVTGGVKIGRSAMSVSVAAGGAAAIDEFFLQASQEIRTGEESAFAIGGSMILGGLLGTGAGALTAAAVKRAAPTAEMLPEGINEFNETINNSLSAADPNADLTLRREEIFQTLNSIPVLRGLVRSDPILRAQLSPNQEVRRLLAELVETPLQYKANETGEVVAPHAVETIVKSRQNTELVTALSELNRNFSEYVKDGPVGMVGRMTAPLTARFGHLAGMEQKLNQTDFMKEVGHALMGGDTHPIPQVAKAAQTLRSEIFDRIKDDMTELGQFDPDMKLENAVSYFMRSYNTEKIASHMGDGTDADFSRVLNDEFMRKRGEAQDRLARDRTVDQLEADVSRLKQVARTAQKSFKTAQDKAKSKAGRAKAAIKREGAVGRVSAALRKDFKNRMEGLLEKTMTGDTRDAFEQMVKNARRADKMEPPDIFKAISRLGGIRDDGSGELAAALDGRLLSVKRNSGMDADDMRSALSEMGYLPDGMTVNEFYQTLRNANDGEKIYSQREFGPEIEAYEAALELRDTLDEMGIDLNKSIDEILNDLPEFARNQDVARSKASEAGRSANKAGEKVESSEAKLTKAIDRLEEAEARLAELDEVIGPKVRDEVKAAREELADVLPKLKEAKAAKAADEYYSGLDDLEIKSAVEDAVNSILGLKPGEHSYRASLSNPTRARALDVADELLEPWLETDAGKIISDYFRAMVPDIEIMRRFGDLEMTSAKQKIIDEKDRLVKLPKDVKRLAKIEANRDAAIKALGDQADSADIQKILDDASAEIDKLPPQTTKQKRAHVREAELRLKELDAMRDRIRGTYGAPDDPKDIWVRGARTTRTVSYMGYLGGMTHAAMPDVANVIGRNGIEAAFGTITALTDPKRLGLAAKDAAEMGAAAEWWLNSRAISMSEVMDPYGANTKFERGLGQGAQAFGFATGMIPWNAFWKSTGSAAISSKISKASDAVMQGKATKSDLLKLSENRIDTTMAQRIAKQLDQFGDKDGQLWLPQAKNWTDPEAFEAFRNAMNREMDIMIVTPGQDKPIAWSSEMGRFFSQFKSFAVSAHHRILLSGIQRADAAVLAQFTTAVILGGLVSNTKADLNGYDRKEGAAFWTDAIDRSGLTGWLFEAYGVGKGVPFVGKLLPGDDLSRFQSRSQIMGLAGPSVDMIMNAYEAGNALNNENATYRDVRKLMRPLPGNNIPYLMPLFQQIEDYFVDMADAKPRPE